MCVLALGCFIPALHAQSRFFPLALVLEAAEFAALSGGVWRPDWPASLPPDAFRVTSGDVSGITLEGEGVLLSVRYGPGEDRLREFPFMLNGRMAQVSLAFQCGEIRGITVEFLPGEIWEMEVLEREASCPAFPALVRVQAGGAWYFISLSRWARGITEVWADVQGNVLWMYGFYLAEFAGDLRIRTVRDMANPASPGTDFYYDSWGFPAVISGPGGFFSALRYRDAFLRYWERRPAGSGEDEVFYFQWDAGGFFVRMVAGTGEPGAASGLPSEYRFEYTLDDRGNWIERREIRMVYHAGLLFPVPGAVFTRVLEYRQP